jgi:hypothetical protein
MTFSMPIQKYMSNVDYYAGGKSPEVIAPILGPWSRKYRQFLSIDYSSYDQTISSWLIEDAFSVLAEAFHFPSENDYFYNLYQVVVHDFIHKDFILNEGVLHSDRGVPSGSMFTQIIDSIVNILVARTYFISINEECRMMTMGDDNIIFFDSDISIEDLGSYIRKNFGLIVKTEAKSVAGLTKSDPIWFLSRVWKDSGQWRHPNSLLSRLLFSERRRNYSDQVTPNHVVYAFILTYRLGMDQLIDTGRFMREHPIAKSYIEDVVDSRFLPGALAYIREYTVKPKYRNSKHVLVNLSEVIIHQADIIFDFERANIAC